MSAIDPWSSLAGVVFGAMLRVLWDAWKAKRKPASRPNDPKSPTP